MNLYHSPQKSHRVMGVLVCSFLLAMVIAQMALTGQVSTAAAATPGRHAPGKVDPSSVLGIVADVDSSYKNIPWVRLGYGTCVANNMMGEQLKNTIRHFHEQGVKVMLSICQWTTGPGLFDTGILNDAAQGGADAVQCGNEQMKAGRFNMYITPQNFAKFFDLCQQAMQTVNPGMPIILGAFDPHVGGIDYLPLLQQVRYLDAMQKAMNTLVHPGGHWNWRSQSVGLIDSWHNGYPNQWVNSLYWLFVFWAQQFHVNLQKGDLGKHLWVIEGTGCVNGCGINEKSASAEAIAHILTLITDVKTAMSFHIPFFYFSSRDFYIGKVFWPMGIRDKNGHPKPLRQDLKMGDRVLIMSCPAGKFVAVTQEQLLGSLYNGCALPANYVSILKG